MPVPTFGTVSAGLKTGACHRVQGVTAPTSRLVQITRMVRLVGITQRTVQFRALDPQTLGKVGPVRSLASPDFVRNVLRAIEKEAA